LDESSIQKLLKSGLKKLTYFLTVFGGLLHSNILKYNYINKFFRAKSPIPENFENRFHLYILIGFLKAI
jgi:hypothetical protein